MAQLQDRKTQEISKRKDHEGGIIACHWGGGGKKGAKQNNIRRLRRRRERHQAIRPVGLGGRGQARMQSRKDDKERKGSEGVTCETRGKKGPTLGEGGSYTSEKS